MNKQRIIYFAMVAMATLPATDILARGGGRGGGGVAGGARPAVSPAYNRSPSMSRPAMPAMPAQHPAVSGGGQFQQFQRPAYNPMPGPAAGGYRPGLAGPAASTRPAMQSPQSFERPNQGQLNSFLNLPGQPSPGAFSGAATPPASQLPSGGGTRTVTTPGGATITVGARGGSGTTAGGIQVGGGAAGVKIEGPGGQTYVKAGGAVGASNGTNSAVAGRGVTGVQGKHGYTAVNVRGGYGAGGTGQIGSATGIRGPGGNTVAFGHGASFVHGQFVGGQAWQAVNGSFTHWNCFRPGWYGRYPGCWWPGKWAVASTAWATATWAVAGSYCGCTGAPAYYDYGENVTYDDGTVYNGTDPVASAEEYYGQADQIAESGDSTPNDDWLPLGVFAVISDGQTNADKIAQLAVNKDGVIRGNLHDLLVDAVIPVTGAVDKQTQRVAMKIQGRDSIVVETGLYNLTNDEVPVLVHFGADRQETRTLIRLEQPEETSPPQ